MMKKYFFLLLLPLCLLGNVELSTPKNPNQEKEAPQEEELRPEATTNPFLESSHQKQLFTTLFFLGILLTFFFIVIYIYRRGTPITTITSKNSKNNIKILERRALSPQTYLYHIQVGDKQFILSESKVDTRFITHLDWSDRK